MQSAKSDSQITGAMPQGHLSLQWRDGYRQQLPNYQDFLRNSADVIYCEVVNIRPSLRLPWRYTEEQQRLYRTWDCSAVWLHSAAQPNGTVYLGTLYADLEAINIIATDKSKCQYTLLVSPNGMSYDANRFGGDHQVATANGNRFTFSVHKGILPDSKVLLAVSWDA
ncbi:hypothetical protein TSOC_011932 [Tetrabaena socialis]|uniref:Uncharacterized protein n=1 Tax=Tetrabaena socialis TaxID=47790 RepID=A0A2J7ZPB7_9CHLO|nr:hypothetical protein TSOC_011932 [Tetrabaena socialis]|eukprot:PNH02117.1 hypothetical protein TSOC_011932 [Tetrabaena socialis]